MSVEGEIYYRLSNYSGLTALVSTRIYPNQLPQNTTLPAISYRRVSGLRYSAFGNDSGVVTCRFQFDIWADGVSGYDSAIAIRDQLRGALQRWSTAGAIDTQVFDTYLLNELDLYETNSEQQHLVLDYEINYKES